MNNEKSHLPEIQSRIDSDVWSQNIARNVSNEYERKQTRNQIILSVSAIFIIGLLTTVSYFAPDDFSNSSLTELETYQFFFSDDFTSLYDTIYQDENIGNYSVWFATEAQRHRE